MDKKTDLVFEYFEKKYGFDIEKLGIDKYQIQHIFQNNHRYFDKKDSIKILILHIEKMIDTQIKDNKKKIISNSFLEKEPKKAIIIEPTKSIVKKSGKIYIDSKDRDFAKYKFPSQFTVDLKVSPKEIKIKEVILRTTEKEKDSSDNLENLPYLILDLSSELIQGTNKNLEASSCLLTNYDIKGEYRYFNIDEKVIFPKNVNKISINIKKPDGTIYNLGSTNNNYIKTVLLLCLEYFE
tara:strand:+ start:224 stop:937 length:714 start_codon:yes stop_codon:yes gene_type:complete